VKASRSFNSHELDVLARLIQENIRLGREAGLPYYRAAGEKLIKAKGLIPHGQFSAWVKKNFGVSARTARDWMRLARQQNGGAPPVSTLSGFTSPNRAPDHRPAPPSPEPVREALRRQASSRLTSSEASSTTFFRDELTEIHLGDARKILPTLPRGLIVTDPVYNVGYHYDLYADNLAPDEYQELLKATCIPPCVVILYAEPLFDLAETLRQKPNRIVSWVYPSNTSRQSRAIAWFGCEPDFTLDGQDYRNPKDKRISKLIEKGKKARLYDWWLVDQIKNTSVEKTAHPCQIPELVMSRILKITPGFDLIIDPYCGSGSTLKAARDLGIRSLGIEISRAYCEIAKQRVLGAVAERKAA
jgi:DNA modification methylase